MISRIAAGGDVVRGWLIYGPNSVGKSSLMRSAGLAVLMAQAGMHVAADALELCPYERLYCRIGTHDDLTHSTYVNELREIRTILAGADARSIVLGDELLASTEAQSALSMVGAALERLTARRTSFMFATHLHELTDLPSVRAIVGLRIAHLRVRVVDGALALDRTLCDGQGMRAYGIEIAEAMGFDAEFVRAAHAIRRHLQGVPDRLVCPRTSRYNARKVVDRCEVCGVAMATETHHAVPQAAADAHGLVGGGKHVHRAYNLVAVCEACHLKAHHAGAAGGKKDDAATAGGGLRRVTLLDGRGPRWVLDAGSPTAPA